MEVWRLFDGMIKTVLFSLGEVYWQSVMRSGAFLDFSILQSNIVSNRPVTLGH